MQTKARKLLLILIVVLASVVTVRAGPYEDAFVAYQRGDYVEAMKFYRLLAEGGSSYARRALGIMYDMGQGVPRNFAEAMKWYRRAADQGDAQAQNNVGLLLFTGSGVPQNYVEAYKWLTLALANATDEDGRYLAATNRELVAAKMTAGQIDQAEKLAAEWTPKAEH